MVYCNIYVLYVFCMRIVLYLRVTLVLRIISGTTVLHNRDRGGQYENENTHGRGDIMRNAGATFDVTAPFSFFVTVCGDGFAHGRKVAGGGVGGNVVEKEGGGRTVVAAGPVWRMKSPVWRMKRGARG
jgi:hypothetical protein